MTLDHIYTEQQEMSTPEEACNDIWVFGYGSLVWKTNFPFDDLEIGHIKGFNRRFWQGSADHRGTSEKPGRVVTVIPTDNSMDEVWGVAYQISPGKVDSTFEYLNFREKNGYSLEKVTFYPLDSKRAPFEVPIYISAVDNPHFLGPATVEDMALQIYLSRGESGPNAEYLLKLAHFMRESVPHVKDSHLFELERAVHKLMLNNTAQG